MKEKKRTAKDEKQASSEGLMRKMLPVGTRTHAHAPTHTEQSLKSPWSELFGHNNNAGVNNIGKWQERLTFQSSSDCRK